MADAVLRSRRERPAGPPEDEEAGTYKQIAKLQRKVSEPVLDIDILKAANKGRPVREPACSQ